MQLTIESEREGEARWIAGIPELPGCLVHGATQQEALARAQILALRVLADRIERGELIAAAISISIAPGADADLRGRERAQRSTGPKSDET